MTPVPSESVSVWDVSGRIAAEDVAAPGPVPHFPRSAMDGFICHEADLCDAAPEHPVHLRVTGAVQMGESPAIGPARGEAWTITTGGPIPQRGDSVVPFELTRLQDEVLRIDRPVSKKPNVSRAGEDITSGVRLVAAGDTVAPATAGALAACGLMRLRVFKRPRVAVLATGNEVEEAPAEPAVPPPGRIFNSNSVTLVCALRAAGCAADYRGVVPDHPESLRSIFAPLASEYDLVISTGGVSVGRFDAVHRTWLDLGAERILGRVDLKPGGPFFAGRLRDACVIGLSGTPVACLAAFHLLVYPCLKRLEGRSHVVRPLRRGVLSVGFPRPTERMRALWARTARRANEPLGLEPLVGRPEGNFASLLAADALVLLPPGTPALPRGSEVTALLLDRPEEGDRLIIDPAVSAPLVIGVVGESGSGKTTVITHVAGRLAGDGFRVAAIKHAAHGLTIDRPHSDSARMAEAGADIVIVAGPDETVLRIGAGIEDPDRLVLIAMEAGTKIWGSRPDVIFVEGFRHPGRPIIQVGRTKSELDTGEAWEAIPAIGDATPAEWQGALSRLSASVRERLRPASESALRSYR